MYKRMLVPMDGSNVSEIVFEYATALARRLNLDLLFLHVCEPEEAEFVPMHRAYVNQIAANASLEFGVIKKKTLPEAVDKTPRARGELVIGYPYEEILRLANERKVDLILMATHGHSGIGSRGMGNVAHKILGASKVPLWFVPATIPGEIVHNEWPTTRFLVPLDGSPLAELALPHVEAVAKQRGIELVDVVLFRVCESVPGKQKPNTSENTANQQHECREYLRRVAKRLQEAGLKVQSETVIGNPSDEIIDYTQRHPFNLVIMSTHGQSGQTRLACGNVADKVLRGISSPILLIRPNQ